MSKLKTFYCYYQQSGHSVNFVGVNQKLSWMSRSKVYMTLIIQAHRMSVSNCTPFRGVDFKLQERNISIQYLIEN